MGSLSPVWLKQRLEREWMRAEYAEEELQATRARRDAADTQIKNLKVSANTLCDYFRAWPFSCRAAAIAHAMPKLASGGQ